MVHTSAQAHQEKPSQTSNHSQGRAESSKGHARIHAKKPRALEKVKSPRTSDEIKDIIAESLRPFAESEVPERIILKISFTNRLLLRALCSVAPPIGNKLKKEYELSLLNDLKESGALSRDPLTRLEQLRQLLSYHCSMLQPHHAETVLSEIAFMGVGPNVIDANYMLQLYANLNWRNRVRETVEKMAREKVALNDDSYIALIHASDNWADALRYSERVVDRTNLIYIAVMIGRMKVLGKLGWLREFWDAFRRKYDSKVTVQMYQSLVDAYALEPDVTQGLITMHEFFSNPRMLKESNISCYEVIELFVTEYKPFMTKQQKLDFDKEKDAWREAKKKADEQNSYRRSSYYNVE